MKNLKEMWQAAYRGYLEAFCERHEEYDMRYVYIIGDAYDRTVQLNDDEFADIDDIRYDVDNDVPVNEFSDWYDYEDDIRSLEMECELLFGQRSKLKHINYPSWCMGAPRPYTSEEIKNMQDGIEAVRKSKAEFDKEIEKFKDKMRKDNEKDSI